MTFVLFVIFGSLEGLAIFYMCCSLFRFRANSYVYKFIIVDVLINIGNYLIRQEESLSSLAPLFSLIMILLFLKIFLSEVSLLWAAIIGLVGFISGGLIQSILLIPLVVFNVITLATIQDHHVIKYSLQLFTAIILYLVAQSLYRRGIGFTFTVDRFKLAGENIVMLVILFALLIVLGIVFSLNDLLLATIILLLPFIYLIYFAIRKQKNDVSNTSFLE